MFHQHFAIRMQNNLNEDLINQPTISSLKHHLQTTTFQKLIWISQYYMLELETIVVI